MHCHTQDTSRAAPSRGQMVGHSLPKAMANKLVGAGASVGSVAVRNAEQKSMAFSASLSETAPRVLSLQRDWLRSIPWIKRAYNIRLSEAVRSDPALFDCVSNPKFWAMAFFPNGKVPPHRPCARDTHAPPPTPPVWQSMRAAITGAFKDKKANQDVHTVNRLVIMGRMELEETLMLWKGASHVSNWFDSAVEAEKAKAKPAPGFLADFLAGK